MIRSLPLLAALTLLLSPQAALAQVSISQVSPPDASEFNHPVEGSSITVGEPSPIAEAPERPAAPIHQGGPALLPWQTGAQQPAPFAASDAPPAPVTATTTTTAPDAAPIESEEPPPTNTVLLQGLNKVTGHVSKLEGPIGIVLTFDNLEIITRRCWKSPPDQQPENAALLEIREIKPGEQPKKLFLGWMFSSSPGLSGLEHPVYDINIVACEFRENPEGTPEPKDEPAKEEKPKEAKPKESKAKDGKAKASSAKKPKSK